MNFHIVDDSYDYLRTNKPWFFNKLLDVITLLFIDLIKCSINIKLTCRKQRVQRLSMVYLLSFTKCGRGLLDVTLRLLWRIFKY